VGVEDFERAEAQRFDGAEAIPSGAEGAGGPGGGAAVAREQAGPNLRELQAELKAETGTQVSTPHLWKIVGELGFRLKKNRSTPHAANLNEWLIVNVRNIKGAHFAVGCGYSHHHSSKGAPL